MAPKTNPTDNKNVAAESIESKLISAELWSCVRFCEYGWEWVITLFPTTWLCEKRCVDAHMKTNSVTMNTETRCLNRLKSENTILLCKTSAKIGNF